jgi:hypothetical protein
MSLHRIRPVNPIRSALEQAMLSPRVQLAVNGFVNALVNEGEAILRQRYAGETLRMYQPKRARADQRDERDRRIRADKAGGMPVALIAERESITVRQVRRIVEAG